MPRKIRHPIKRRKIKRRKLRGGAGERERQGGLIGRFRDFKKGATDWIWGEEKKTNAERAMDYAQDKLSDAWNSTPVKAGAAAVGAAASAAVVAAILSKINKNKETVANEVVKESPDVNQNERLLLENNHLKDQLLGNLSYSKHDLNKRPGRAMIVNDPVNLGSHVIIPHPAAIEQMANNREMLIPDDEDPVAWIEKDGVRYLRHSLPSKGQIRAGRVYAT